LWQLRLGSVLLGVIVDLPLHHPNMPIRRERMAHPRATSRVR
jgi:hypothetical protein